MLQSNVSTVAQNGQTKCCFKRRPFVLYVSFVSTVGFPKLGRGSRGIFSQVQSATSPLDATKSNTLDL